MIPAAAGDLAGPTERVSLRERAVPESVFRSWCARSVVCLALSVACSPVAGAILHVWPGGDNSDGFSRATAFHTLQQAANVVEPGDVILVGSGTYSNSGPGEVLILERSGTASAWITIMPFPGESPLIKFNGWGGIKIQGSASYIEITRLQIEGNNDRVTLEEARIQESTRLPEARFSGNGILIDGRKSGPDKPHHIRIAHTRVSRCGGGGIAVVQADYVTIEGNEVFDCAWYAPYANSGISLYQSWNFDSGDGYRNRILGNRCFNNRSLVRWIYARPPRLSDGNGIIIDDSMNTQNGSIEGPYQGRTLVANNVVFNNGGSGMHSYMSEHVHFLNNTSYQNGWVIDYPEIFASHSHDVVIAGNIVSARHGGRCNANTATTEVTFRGNLYFNGTVEAVGTGDILADPQFVAPALDAEADFRLRESSPAIDSSDLPDDVHLPSCDILGGTRAGGGRIDRGAFEYGATPLGPALIVSQPVSAQVVEGDACELRLVAESRGRTAYVWTFRALEQDAPEVVQFGPEPVFHVGCAQRADAGTYVAWVVNEAGASASQAAALEVQPVDLAAATRLINISTRGFVGTGDAVLIAGFVIAGQTARPLVVRGIGPALHRFGVPEPVPWPHVSLRESSGTELIANAGWDAAGQGDVLAAQFARLGAFGLPRGSDDASLYLQLMPGAYTAIVTGRDGSTGMALAEVYDAADVPHEPSAPAVLNISTRGWVGTGDQVLIAGFVVSGSGPRRYLVRAVGPTLDQFRVSHALRDPTVTLYRGGDALRTNGSWSSLPAVRQEIRRVAENVGAVSMASPREAALLVTLEPGAYTAVVRGEGALEGVALVEVYDVSG